MKHVFWPKAKFEGHFLCLKGCAFHICINILLLLFFWVKMQSTGSKKDLRHYYLMRQNLCWRGEIVSALVLLYY